MLLQTIAFLLVEGPLAAEPDLAPPFRRGLDTESGMACREIQGHGWKEIVEEHHRPLRSTCRTRIDVRVLGVLGPGPRQEPHEIDEPYGALPEPGRPGRVGTISWTTNSEVDTIDADGLPPGEHSTCVIPGSHSVLTRGVKTV